MLRAAGINCKINITPFRGNFNHSCNPNAGCKGTIFLIAMRNIRKDEEVTFDYAMDLHRTRGCKPHRLPCQCGEDNCRRVITDMDWRIPELQTRYRGYFQWYIEEAIAKRTGIDQRIGA